MLTLYGMQGTRSTRVAWALEEAGAEYTFIPVNLRAGEHKKSEFLVINPSGKVPVLVDDDLVLSESAAICTYLGEKFPQSGLLPTDLAARASYFQWCFFAMTELEAHLWTRFKHTALLPEERRVAAIVPVCVWEFDKSAAVLAQHMQEREFAAGTHFTAADILLGTVLNWAKSQEIALPATLESYVERVMSRPALAQAKAKGFA